MMARELGIFDANQEEKTKVLEREAQSTQKKKE